MTKIAKTLYYVCITNLRGGGGDAQFIFSTKHFYRAFIFTQHHVFPLSSSLPLLCHLPICRNTLYQEPKSHHIPEILLGSREGSSTCPKKKKSGPFINTKKHLKYHNSKCLDPRGKMWTDKTICFHSNRSQLPQQENPKKCNKAEAEVKGPLFPPHFQLPVYPTSRY